MGNIRAERTRLNQMGPAREALRLSDQEKLRWILHEKHSGWENKTH